MKEEIKTELLNIGVVKDNEYLDQYIELIYKNKDTKKQTYKTQKHHIIPKCYYKSRGLKTDNSPKNIVNLLYKDHILAHYYLCLCVSSKELKYPFLLAFTYLINRVDVLKNTQIDNLLLNIQDSKDEIICSLEHYQKLYEELKILKGEMTKGRTPHNKGKKCDIGRWMTDGKINRRVKDEDVQTFLDSGWVYGRYNIDEIVAKFSNTMTGRPSPKRGSAMSEEQKEKLRQANLGKKQSPETIEKRRKKLVGHEVSEETKQRLRDANAGQKRSDEAKKKMSEAKKGKSPSNKGLPMSEEQKRKLSEVQKGKIWITNGIEDHLITPEDLSLYERIGFYRGRSYSQNEN